MLSPMRCPPLAIDQKGSSHFTKELRVGIGGMDAHVYFVLDLAPRLVRRLLAVEGSEVLLSLGLIV